MFCKVKNIGNDIKVELIEKEEIIGEAVCFFENTPIVSGKRIGCIGEFSSRDKNIGKMVLKKCEELFDDTDVELIVGPMDRNTWQKYRTLKWSRGDDEFLLENVNKIEDNDVFLECGFKELYTYTSNKGDLKDCYTSPALEAAKENLEKNNIKIRTFNKENYITDLRKIFNISKSSFSRNPFYTRIDEKTFMNQYEKYIDMIEEEYVLIAERFGKEVGFIFCIPNYNELKSGKPMDSLIVKTVAVLPEYEHLVLGNVLLNKIGTLAKENGYKSWIFAFMYSDNTSQKMAKRNKTEVIREYAIYGKYI